MILSLFKKGQRSFSQSGEDLIIRRALSRMGINRPTYLDIGANDPVINSNTYLLYTKGSRGVLVEPDPFLFRKLKKKRSKDILINCGIGLCNDELADFYVMSNKSLNTFSKKDAEKVQSYGKEKIEKIIKVPIITINEVIKKNLDRFPNFISIDVEGLDLELLITFDFDKYQPELFCIETITYTQDNSETKEKEIFEYMESKGYMAFADTYINTIFVDRNKWLKR